MFSSQALLLVAAVAAVGVLHTLVPDHWLPIVLIARQRGWSQFETIRAAVIAGAGHTLSTLAIGAIVWIAGVEIGGRFGHAVDAIASLALVAFGLWIAVGSLREMRAAGGGHHHHGAHDHGHHHGHSDGYDHHDHGHETIGQPAARLESDPLYARLSTAPVALQHAHLHRHGGGRPHVHWHDHDAAGAHAITLDVESAPPLHTHAHKTTARTALLLILGSSPMIEGIPAFFAASKYGIAELVLMAIVFALSTIATYAVLCAASLAGANRVSLGPLERYGEVLSGAFIAVVGAAFWFWPAF